jgi:hypothetical protein
MYEAEIAEPQESAGQAHAENDFFKNHDHQAGIMPKCVPGRVCECVRTCDRDLPISGNE